MTKPANILWICTDQQRTDTLGCYGADFAATPHIDALARSGVLFERAYVQSPVCTPSRASFLTGRYPRTTRCRQNGQTLPSDEVLVTRLLADTGYATGLSGKLHLSGNHPSRGRASERRIDDGYDAFYWSHHPDPDWVGNAYIHWLHGRGQKYQRRTSDVSSYVHWGMPAEHHQTTWCVEMAMDFIRTATDAGTPWLFSINFFDPHHPFDPPRDYLDACATRPGAPALVGSADELEHKPWVQGLDSAGAYNEEGLYPFGDMTPQDHRAIRAAYQGMVDLIDDQCGRLFGLLDELSIRDDTLIIFMSDHGEMLGDHGIYLKGPYFYEPLVKVPLIVAGPRIKPRRSAALVEMVDLVPTLLERAGRPVPSGVQGRTLNPLLGGDTDDHRASVYCEYYNAMPWHRDPTPQATMVRDERFKLALMHGTGQGELYDLQADPEEVDNLFGDPGHLETERRLLHALADRMAFTVDPDPPREVPW